jgi:SAM-dependent methyltransferase
MELLRSICSAAEDASVDIRPGQFTNAESGKTLGDDARVNEELSLRETFNAAAATYQAARPEYPDALYDDLIADARLAAGARLLEIGCATGKATRPLLERGFTVVCVELGDALAKRARNDFVGMPFAVHVSAFEAWQPDGEDFDLVYAATAWHWIDPAIRYKKAHELLRPGGHLAFWGAAHALPPGFDGFFTEIQEVYDAIGESHPGEWPPPTPDEIPDASDEIIESGFFDQVKVHRYVWATRYTADEYIALLNTFSGHIAMEKTRRDRLYAEIRRRIARRDDGSVLRHWYSILHVATRK